jgi:hypothetical protein
LKNLKKKKNRPGNANQLTQAGKQQDWDLRLVRKATEPPCLTSTVYVLVYKKAKAQQAL